MTFLIWFILEFPTYNFGHLFSSESDFFLFFALFSIEKKWEKFFLKFVNKCCSLSSQNYKMRPFPEFPTTVPQKNSSENPSRIDVFNDF